MENPSWLLRSVGYEIVWLSGDYCRAFLDGRDSLFRWNGEDWIVV